MIMPIHIDAMMFKSESNSVASGLIGIPMLAVKLQALETTI